MSCAITLTTINLPYVIEDFIVNILKYEHSDVEFIITGDNKTPNGIENYLNNLSNKYNIKIHYLSINDQIKFLKDFPALNKYIPFNCIQRRNIGDLYALKYSYKKIIRIDDDNIPTNDDFIGFHNIVGTNFTGNVISSNNGWDNICDELIDENGIDFYPRGYLYEKRWEETTTYKFNKKVKIVLNAGLWLGDPDIDAITRINRTINVIKYKNSFRNNFVLDADTWSPINTQNTCYSSEIIPASLVLPHVGRFDDIWGNYLLRKVIDVMGHYTSYGKPIVIQERNEHDLWKDLEQELNGYKYGKYFIDRINEIELKGKTYLDCYFELATNLDALIEENKSIFSKVTSGMKIWADTCSKIIN